MKKRVTIHDIARLANVSSATVSRVLSSSNYPVSPKLRTKIQEMAAEHNYIPNMIGKQLKTNNNMTIGVIIPTISNPFYAAVILGIEEVARKKGYHVLLCNSLQDEKLEEAYLTNLFEKQVTGLIISSISGNHTLLSSLIELGLEVIAIDQKIDLTEVQQIEFDYYRGGFMAANYLIEQGHRKIAYLSSPLNRPSRLRIYEGFLEALRQAGIDKDDELIQIGDNEKEIYEGIYEFENGKSLTKALLNKKSSPTAIFACNDLTAFGAIHELQAQNLRVPMDISVIGFDNIEFAQMITPSLTTIKQPNYEMGKLACTILLDKLNGESSDMGDVHLQPKLILRNSVTRLFNVEEPILNH